MSSARQSSLRRWPFWLLIAAWFCANTPQVAALHAILWAKGATHFSHQARLTRDVQALITGRVAPSENEAVIATATAERPDVPALPAEALVKKITLCAGDAHASPRGDPTVAPPAVPAFQIPDGFVGDVPHPPPRGRLA